MEFFRRLHSLQVPLAILAVVAQVIPLAVTISLPLDKTSLRSTLTKCLLDKEGSYKTPKVPFYVSNPTPLISREAASINADCRTIIRSFLRGDYNLYNLYNPYDGLETPDASAYRKSVIKNVPFFHPELIKLDEEPGKQEYQPFLDDGRSEYFQMLMNYPAELKTRQFSNNEPRMKMKLSNEDSRLKSHQNLNNKDKDYSAGYLLEDFADKQLFKTPEQGSRVPDVTSRHVSMNPLERGAPIKRFSVDTFRQTLADVMYSQARQNKERSRENLRQGMYKDGR